MPTPFTRGAAPQPGGEPLSRPVHLRASALGLVCLGGTAGVAAREALTLLWPPAGGVPWATLVINVIGAFLLGVLLEALTRHGFDRECRHVWRLVFGTGVLGSFTTYSALAVDTATLLGSGAPALGVGYGLGTVALGGVVTWAGVALSALMHRRRSAGAR